MNSHHLTSPYDFTLKEFDAIRNPYENIDKFF